MSRRIDNVTFILALLAGACADTESYPAASAPGAGGSSGAAGSSAGGAGGTAGAGGSAAGAAGASGAGSAGAAGSGGAAGGAGSAGGPVAKLRDVSTRSPFGQLDPTNLLHDGDFELSGRDALQYPWLGLAQRQIRVGSVCRSGLRCVSVDKEEYVAGVFVWPDAPGVEVSFHGRVESDDCEKDGIGLILALDDQLAQPVYVTAETPSPVDGWCKYRDVVKVPKTPGYHFWALLVAARSEGTGAVVFDDASIRPVQAGAEARRAYVPTSDVAGLADRARVRLRGLLPPNPPRAPRPVANPTGRRAPRL